MARVWGKKMRGREVTRGRKKDESLGHSPKEKNMKRKKRSCDRRGPAVTEEIGGGVRVCGLRSGEASEESCKGRKGGKKSTEGQDQ